MIGKSGDGQPWVVRCTIGTYVHPCGSCGRWTDSVCNDRRLCRPCMGGALSAFLRQRTGEGLELKTAPPIDEIDTFELMMGDKIHLWPGYMPSDVVETRKGETDG